MIKNIFFIIIPVCLIVFFSFGQAYTGERFMDNGDGTVTDQHTNLMWAASDNMGDITWHDAKVYCENPPIAGYKYSGWRMPTIEELKTLYNKELPRRETDCGLNVRTFPGFLLSCAWVWSGESRAISAYAFSFRKGYPYLTLMLNKKHFRALPVRTVK